MRHIVSVHDFDNVDLNVFFRQIRRIKAGRKIIGSLPLAGRILGSLFYEPSTRTRLSFEAAMLRSGGAVISTENAKLFSSAAKGETLEDSVRVVSNYCDVIALRHPDDFAADCAAKVATVPLINAGDGANEHPTQALLDLYTIWEACESGRLERKRLVLHFYGDNYRSRTVHSLALLLAKHAQSLDIAIERVYFGGSYARSAQPSVAFYETLSDAGLPITMANTGLGTPTGVLYLTRAQNERKDAVFGTVGDERHFAPAFDLAHARMMSQRSIIMHPLPRNEELSPEVDEDERAWYFTQAKNGLFVRMGLLEMLLK